jgi:hypothetical protein
LPSFELLLKLPQVISKFCFEIDPLYKIAQKRGFIKLKSPLFLPDFYFRTAFTAASAHSRINLASLCL